MRSFQKATLSEFKDLIDAYPFTREITDIDLHQGKNPRIEAYRGAATLEAMWRITPIEKAGRILLST